MKIKFWGTRGSIPTPACEGFSTSRYGGNTPCVEIKTRNGTTIIIDTGTGARPLGNKLMGLAPDNRKLENTPFSMGKGRVYVFFSHFHWDHIQGLPFFKPLFVEGNTIDFYGGKGCKKNLAYQMKKPFFPVEIDNTLSNKNYHDFVDGDTVRIGNVKITVRKLDHTDDVYGFRVQDSKKVFTYASDVEHNLDNEKNLYELAKGSDMLVYDCQYTFMEYAPEVHGKEGTGKKQWGHSIIQEGIKIASAVGVKKLVSFHHGPESPDIKIDDVIKFAQRYKMNYSKSLEIIAAQEGLEIEV